MASIIKVDRILDSTELGKVDIPGGIETDVLNATELVANTWKNVDGTENYKCRAWVNFNGITTPPTIKASGNVSSVVRNATGDYTVNFETALEDTNFSAFCDIGRSDRFGATGEVRTTSSVNARVQQSSALNSEFMSVMVFR